MVTAAVEHYLLKYLQPYAMDSAGTSKLQKDLKEKISSHLVS